MLNTPRALVYTLVLGAVIFFCRVLPFIVFREKTGKTKKRKSGDPGAGTRETPVRSGMETLLGFVETVVPPAAMTVLAFNALASPLRDLVRAGPAQDAGRFLAVLGVFAAAVCTALLHLWKRNALISIFGGTALYMLLERLARIFFEKI
ncbi:MAG: AzlD domain-containing protein [Treponema sp.]|nr:AzlD domain-containing protein [Treponema sp.]